MIRTVLANSLLEDSRRLMQIPDWDAAEARLRELLALDANHAGAQSLASEFADLKTEALNRGFLYCESGPLVRSSYHAGEQLDSVRRHIAALRESRRPGASA